MSKLKEYRDVERALTENLQNLERLKNDAALIKELEFEKKLTMLLNRYSKRMEDLLAFISPGTVSGLKVQEQTPSYRGTARKSRK
jgi:hypothetical protein